MATTRSIDPTTYSSNPYIQALISDRVWSSGDTITYYLKPTDLNGNGLNDLNEKGAAAAITAAYDAFAAVANIRGQQVSNAADAVWIEQVAPGSGGATHTLPYIRNRATQESGGNYKIVDTNPAELAKGGQWYGIVLHEIGHGLGLEHTHESGLFPGVAADDANAPGDNGLNSKLYSIMSYNGLTSFSYGTPVTPMALDIAAVQALYGANMTTATGNDVYVLPTQNAVGTYYACIWDAGGTDTLSVGSGAATGATLDLRAATLRDEPGGGGYLSSVNGIKGGFTIANGVVIENAVGSSHADVITGNVANNRLTGNGGVDRISGLDGDDTLIAGDGSVYALDKPQGQVIATQAKAASLDAFFTLSVDATIADATTTPHATVRAIASGQSEWYSFTVAKAGQIKIDIDAASFDTEIYLHNATGTQLATNDDGSPVDPGSVIDPGNSAESYDSALTYNVTQPGTYYVRVERYGVDATTQGGAYTMHISVPGATVTASGYQGSTLDGGDGADTLIGGSADDILIGGAGDDVYAVGNAGDQVIEAVGGGNDTVVATVGYSLAARQQIETLQFASSTGSAALNLSGNEFANTLLGNAGANTLNGRGGADILEGLGGNDVYAVDNAGDQVVETAGGGTDTVVATVSYSLAAGQQVETLQLASSTVSAALNLSGNEFANTIYGNGGANMLNGRGGADILKGMAGNDVYAVDNAGDQVIEAAGGGSDTVVATVSYTLAAGQEIEALQLASSTGSTALDLTGNAFANTIRGNAGHNVLDGGAGADTLVGNAGADTFVFKTALGASNIDHIVDFAASASGVHDTIQLGRGVFTALPGTGELQAAAFKDVSVEGPDADDRILYNKTTGAVSYDADGSGATAAAVQFAVIDNYAALSFHDFLIVA